MLGNHLKIVQILVLAMTTADDDASGSNFVSEVVVRFSLFYKQNGAFWLAKSRTINFSFKDYFDRSICSFQRLAGQKKTIQVRSSSKFKSSLQRTCRHSVQLKEIASCKHRCQSEVCSMYCEK